MRYHELVSSNRIQTCALSVEKNLYIMEIWKGKIYASFGTLDIKYQFFIRISSSLGKAELYEGTKSIIFLDVFGLFSKPHPMINA